MSPYRKVDENISMPEGYQHAIVPCSKNTAPVSWLTGESLLPSEFSMLFLFPSMISVDDLLPSSPWKTSTRDLILQPKQQTKKKPTDFLVQNIFHNQSSVIILPRNFNQFFLQSFPSCKVCYLKNEYCTSLGIVYSWEKFTKKKNIQEALNLEKRFRYNEILWKGLRFLHLLKNRASPRER